MERNVLVLARLRLELNDQHLATQFLANPCKEQLLGFTQPVFVPFAFNEEKAASIRFE